MSRMLVEIGPPSYTVNPRLKFRIRFSAVTAQAASAYTYAAMLLAIAVKSGVATEAGIMGIFDAVRFRRIDIWAPASAGSVAASTVGFEFASNSVSEFGEDSSRRTDTSSNTSYSAFISSKPKSDALSSKWFNPTSAAVTNSYAIGFITCPANSIIDIHLEGVLTDSTGLYYTSATVTGLIAGLYSFRPATGLNPVDYNLFL